MKSNNPTKDYPLAMFEIKKKIPGWAAFWSLLIIGAGHFYIGRYGRGVSFFLFQSFLIFMHIFNKSNTDLFFILIWIVIFIAPLDAYREAENHNKELKLILGLN